MDRDITIGNRVVANYMQDKQKKRLKQRLKLIKTNKSDYSSQGFIKEKQRVNSLFFQKSQEIEKQNIHLFQRIASIIKKTPKVNTETTMSLQKSRETSTIWHRKIQSSLQNQNKIIQKRLFNQKPTINNKSFYQQRAKHLQYLKNMSKYPYILNKKLNTQPDSNILDQFNINFTQLPPLANTNNSQQCLNHNEDENSSRQLFKHKSLDFTITVSLDLKSDLCTFLIENNNTQDEKYSLVIPKTQFVTYFEQSDYDYEKMISNLRLNDQGKIIYTQEVQRKYNDTPIEEKEISKFRAQSTAYTSTGFKQGFRLTKRNITEKYVKNEKQASKTDRKIKRYQTETEQKPQTNKQTDVMSEYKFKQVKMTPKP